MLLSLLRSCISLCWRAGTRQGGGCRSLPVRGVVFVEASWGVLLRWAYCMLLYAVYVASGSSACGFGRPGVLLSVSAVNNTKLAFREFHLLTGLSAIG